MQWLLAGTGTEKVLQPRAWDLGTWLGVCSGFGAAAAPQPAGCNGVAPLFLHQLQLEAFTDLAPAGSRSLPPHSPTNLGNPTRDIPQEFLAGRKPTLGSPPLAGSTHRRRLLRVVFPAAMAVGLLPSSDALLLLLLFRATAVKTLTRARGERGQLSASPAPAELLPAVVPPPKKKNSGGAEEFETEGNSHFSPQISARRRAESPAGARRGSQPAGLARCQKANTASAANI